MMKYFFNKMLTKMHHRYDYDVGYMRETLEADLGAFIKFMGFQTMATHRGNLPAPILYAARLTAIFWDDCGPCTQLVVDMAIEEHVAPETIRAIIDSDIDRLPEEVALVVKFTELVLAHDASADPLRQNIIDRWGKDGLIAIAFCISSSRVYPAFKYAMGYGKACSRIQINDALLLPNR